MNVHRISEARSYRRTVLVLDDQSTGRVILERLIAKLDPDAHVISFADAPAALECARTRPIDLALIDYKLPTLDGIHVIKMMRMFPTCAQALFIAVTASDEEAVVARLKRVGASAVLSKPINFDSLRDACSAALSPPPDDAA